DILILIGARGTVDHHGLDAEGAQPVDALFGDGRADRDIHFVGDFVEYRHGLALVAAADQLGGGGKSVQPERGGPGDVDPAAVQISVQPASRGVFRTLFEVGARDVELRPPTVVSPLDEQGTDA